MTKITRTWWGERFLAALESCTDSGRLQRGRSYAGPRRLLAFEIKDNIIQSTVRGNINPYFGVYKEPRYKVEIQLKKISAKAWKDIIARLSRNAGWLSRLLLGEMPEDIEDAFADTRYHLLPHSSKELQTHCSCPDWANPCKHVAGTYYHVAGRLDQDPFLLFELRGLTKTALHKELVKSPLGKALSESLQADELPEPEPLANRYPPVPRVPPAESLDYKHFWSGSRLPEPAENNAIPSVPALIIRREGDFPPFWPRENSFIEAMSEIYHLVQKQL
jgi:uncharacterized Zn finger protein